MSKQWDVIIIGGGLAGYVAANYLAKENVSTLILEKSKEIGGRARTINKGGYLFNLGPHALYKKGKAAAIFKELSINVNGRSPALGGTIFYDDWQYEAPFNPLSIIKSSFLTLSERLQWIKIATSFNRFSKGVSTTITFQQWVEQTTSSHRVQALILVLARLATYCHAPEMISAKVVLSHLSLTLGGVLYLDGGWQQLMNQLHQQALLYNTVVKTGSTVTEVKLNQEQLWEIKTNNGDWFSAKYVIYTGPPQQLAALMKQQLTCPFPNIKTVQGASYELALSKLPNEESLFGLDLNAALYYSVHSTYAKLAPNNEVVLHLFKYLHPTQKEPVAETKEELEHFLNRFQPDWKNHVITSQFLPTITVNQRLPQVGEDTLLLNQETKLRRFYFAGDWADPHFILAEGATNSGKMAAQAIIEAEWGGKYDD